MLRLALYGLMLAAPFLTYAGMKAHEKIIVAAAIDGERQAGNIRCAASITKLEADHNKQVEEAARTANDAADRVETPESDADIKALCKKSASCRDRGHS